MDTAGIVVAIAGTNTSYKVLINVGVWILLVGIILSIDGAIKWKAKHNQAENKSIYDSKRGVALNFNCFSCYYFVVIEVVWSFIMFRLFFEGGSPWKPITLYRTYAFSDEKISWYVFIRIIENWLLFINSLISVFL